MSELGNKSVEQLEREAEFLKKEIENVDEVIHSEEKIKHDLEKREHEVEEEARREREKHDHDHHVRITMVVNGQPVVIEAEEKDVVFAVATVTLLGMIAMFVLPAVAGLLAMSQKAFGVWAGLAIHQTPQVIAAGFAYGESAGSTATIVKLARVCLLAPVVFLVGWLHARGEAAEKGHAVKNINYFRLFPMFVFGFLAMALLRTLGLLPDLHFVKSRVFEGGNFPLAQSLDQISKYCIVISMTGVGLETRFAAMKQTGAKPFLASLLAAVVIAVMVLILIRVLGIN